MAEIYPPLELKLPTQTARIDATPIPIGAPNNNYQDFEFPDGYIKEGTVYNVEDVVTVRQSGESVYITGPYVLLNNQHVPWNGKRFRKVGRNKEKMKRGATNRKSSSCLDIP